MSGATHQVDLLEPLRRALRAGGEGAVTEWVAVPEHEEARFEAAGTTREGFGVELVLEATRDRADAWEVCRAAIDGQVCRYMWLDLGGGHAVRVRVVLVREDGDTALALTRLCVTSR